MRILVLAVGKLKERCWKEACGEYVKRLSGFAALETAEVADEWNADKDVALALTRESERIMQRLRPRDYVAALCVDGAAMSSEGFAAFVEESVLQARERLVFIIGGSHGLGGAVIKRADARLSFSPLTFPHQLTRVILLEQLYRAFKIIRKEPYHK
ncbi:MAG: 23S rRNA (pseudouridine(1915)-N(3))-methyltransferase RlmH [Clostridiales bacterium]|jgi:23S rRNA (pseudouridine1915-N3)-methyltransferase|nr:23S rRNA (pseudouridine(1915)-N(3))-methyltransferase RlmH [Clostridiales bacterium]